MKLGKKLETGFKSFISALLKLILKQPQKDSIPSCKKILFLRYGHIGDMILSLPVFRAARANNSTVQIDVICDPNNFFLLNDDPIVDNLYFYEKKFLKTIWLIFQLRKKKYDYICNLVAYPSFTFGILARLIGPKAVRAGGNQEQFSFFYNRLIELPPKMEIHMLERLFKLSADVTGSSISNIETPWLNLSDRIQEKSGTLLKKISSNLDSLNPRVALLNLSAGLERREWDNEKYFEFLETAVNNYKNQIECWAIITNPQNPENALRLVDKINNPVVVQIPIQDDFRIIMALMQKCYLVITPDTSFSHAASSMGTPILNLMIGENVITWAPYGVKHKIISSDDMRSLKNLPVERVLQGLDDLIKMIESN